MALLLVDLLGEAEAGQRPLGPLDEAAVLAAVRELGQAADLALALDPGGVVGRQVTDEVADAVADLEREVRRRGAHQLAHVLDGGLAVGPLDSLVLAHPAAETTSVARRSSPARPASRAATGRRQRSRRCRRGSRRG